MNELLSYHLSNIIILFIFSFIYTTIRLHAFRLCGYFFREFGKNFFSSLFVYGIYIVFTLSKTF